MGIVGYIIIAVLIILVIYFICVYNSLVKLNNNVKEAFSTMDVYLKKRWDLIPNLVETVKGYAKHEKGTLEEVVKLRSGAYDKMSTDEKIENNAKLSAGITKIMALAESYPELKANQNFLSLSSDLSNFEEDIANSRKYYNGAVKIFNNKVMMFPSNIVANILGYKEQKMYEVDSDEERKNVKVQF